MPRVHRASLLTAAFAGVLAAGFAADAVHADWLVMRDGVRFETKGAWKVEGRRVLFTMPNGTLSTVRTDEIDLDQSALVTTQAREAPATPIVVAKEKKEPVLRLTEKDIPPVSAATLAANAADATAGADASGAGKEGEGKGEVSSPLEVISWEKTENGTGDGLEIFGTLKNSGPNTITTPTLLVAIYDAEGGLLASVDGEVNSPQILAGKTANFRVAIPGVPDFASVKFDAQGLGFKPRMENAALDETEAQELEEPTDLPVEEVAPADEPPPL